MATIDQVTEELIKCDEAGNHRGAIDKCCELIGMGEYYAIANLASQIYLLGIDYVNEAKVTQDTALMISYFTQASHLFYSAIKISIDFLASNCEDDEYFKTLAASTITNCFGLLYYIASLGFRYGYTVMEEHFVLKEVVIEKYYDYVVINRNWEHYHEEYVSNLPQGLSVLGALDDQDKFVMNATSQVISDLGEVTEILSAIGRDFDALAASAAVAMKACDFKCGNPERMLTAEWLYTYAVYRAKQELAQDDLTNWIDMQAFLSITYTDLVNRFGDLAVSYKLEGKLPHPKTYYKSSTKPIDVNSNPDYVTADALRANGVSAAKGARFLSMVQKVSFKETIPVFVLSIVCGLFCGGLLFVWNNDGAMAPLMKALAVVFFILTMVITNVRSKRNSLMRDYGTDGKLYVPYMLLLALLLNLHYFIGVIFFVVMKILSGKYKRV